MKECHLKEEGNLNTKECSFRIISREEKINKEGGEQN